MSTNAITKWALDPAHSEVGFKAKHLMISNVSGKFDKIEGTVESSGDDFTTGKVSFSADVNSINTGNGQRDGHLKSPEFFDAANFPSLKFTSTKIEKVSDSEYKLTGDLTIRDKTNPVTVDVELGGVTKDPYGNTKAGFTISGKINRKDWGLNKNMALDGGGLLVSEEIKIYAEVQFAKQA
jgi:polyisoprenoid-binding protein YceI